MFLLMIEDKFLCNIFRVQGYYIVTCAKRKVYELRDQCKGDLRMALRLKFLQDSLLLWTTAIW